MAMTALQIFRMVASEFSAIPDEDETDENENITAYGILAYMELFKDQISERRFGKVYPKALAYLTAHKLKMMGFGDNAGVGGISIADSLRTNSVSEGETSVSFNAGSALNGGDSSADAEYTLTIYGLEFLTLRRNAIIPILSAGETDAI